MQDNRYNFLSFLCFTQLLFYSLQLKIPQNQPLHLLQNLKYTAPLSRPITVQPSGQYNLPTILKWDPKLLLVGGVNVPLRLTFHTSDGKNFRELLKGNDDTRQDAVLEQVSLV